MTIGRSTCFQEEIKLLSNEHKFVLRVETESSVDGCSPVLIPLLWPIVVIAWGASKRAIYIRLRFAEELWWLGEHHLYSGHCFWDGLWDTSKFQAREPSRLAASKASPE